MKITENRITTRELTQDYADDGGGGATGYSGDLDIRPTISARVRLQARAAAGSFQIGGQGCQVFKIKWGGNFCLSS